MLFLSDSVLLDSLIFEVLNLFLFHLMRTIIRMTRINTPPIAADRATINVLFYSMKLLELDEDDSV